MGICKDRAGGSSFRLTTCAVSALLGCAGAVLLPASLARAQSTAQSSPAGQLSAQYPGQPDLAAGGDSLDPAAPALPAPGSAAAKSAKSGKAATPDSTASESGRLNPRLTSGDTDDTTTGSILDEDMRRINTREGNVDNVSVRRGTGSDEPTGVQLGTFTLRPSVNQSVNIERNRTGSTSDNRTFLQTDLRGTLTSDWSRHSLTVTGDGLWQRNLSGNGEEQPLVDINADLRLDLSADTTAHITGGYQFFREDTDDPNAIAGASKQSAVNQFDAGASIERDFGLLRGTTALALTRTVYSDAVLSDGTQVVLSDRDQTAGTLRGRIGYELSPVLIPFIEGDLGRAEYDESHDSSGYARSNRSYGGKAGIEVDLGEKLKGELGFGYQHTDFEDSRLASIDSPTVDGNVAWSPQRGTDVNLGLSTSVQPSTTAGDSGYVAYQFTAGVTHQMRDNLLAKLTGGTTWRDYPSSSIYSDETVYDAATGLTWGINRYLDLTGNVGYELTSRKAGDDTHQLRAGVGLTAKR